MAWVSTRSTLSNSAWRFAANTTCAWTQHRKSCASTLLRSRISHGSSAELLNPPRMWSQGENPHASRGKVTAGLSLTAGAVLVLYPLLMFFGQSRLGATWMALILILICGLRLVAVRFGSSARLARAFGTPQLLVICGAMVLALVSMWRGSHDAMLYYPVLMNAGMLLVFGSSLVSPPTIVERIARLRHPDLP